MSKWLALIVTVAALSLFADSAFASMMFVNIKGTYSKNRIDGICSREGGTSTTGPGGHYGCAKPCTGGVCAVDCKGGKCTGAVPTYQPPGTTYHIPLRPRGILAGRY
jgi:hypothetical protein